MLPELEFFHLGLKSYKKKKKNKKKDLEGDDVKRNGKLWIGHNLRTDKFTGSYFFD